nr:protein ZBED8-like [Procambarus clarkii]
MTEILCGQKEAKRLCSVSLSARDVKERLSSFTEHFAIQLEETIVVSSNSQLMPCVRYSGSDVPKIEVAQYMTHSRTLLVEQLEPELEAVMNDVIKTVNGVKGHALNTRLFRDSCEDGEAEFSGLLSHTEVKWFTRRNVQS